MSKKVIVAGHICLDITPVFPDGEKSSAFEILRPGKLVEMKGASLSAGGAVANTGLAMKKLGADVSLMGKIGSDEFGDMICGILNKYGADKGMIRVEGEKSSYSVVLAIPGVDRIFLHCPGANNTYEADDISSETLKNAALFHFGYPPIMKKMYEHSGSELIKLFKKAKEAGCITSLDMASVDPDSEAGRADWKAILKAVMPYLDFFVPSIEELCFMIDKERFFEWQTRARNKDIAEILDFERDIIPVANMCMEMGTKLLLLKCGAKGLFLKTAGKDVLKSISLIDPDIWKDLQLFEKPFVPDRILSATGAGDTSIAAFLTALLNGEGPKEALRLCSATGAMCLTQYDALSGILGFDDLKKKIASGWKKSGE